MLPKFLGWDYAAYRHVRALIFVSPEPLGGGCLGLIDAHEHVLIEPVISDCSMPSPYGARASPLFFHGFLNHFDVPLAL